MLTEGAPHLSRASWEWGTSQDLCQAVHLPQNSDWLWLHPLKFPAYLGDPPLRPRSGRGPQHLAVLSAPEAFQVSADILSLPILPSPSYDRPACWVTALGLSAKSGSGGKPIMGAPLRWLVFWCCSLSSRCPLMPQQWSLIPPRSPSCSSHQLGLKCYMLDPRSRSPEPWYRAVRPWPQSPDSRHSP